MTGPTREEVQEWRREAEAVASDRAAKFRGIYKHNAAYRDGLVDTVAALAFAAGARSSSTAGAELALDLDLIEESLTDSIRAFEASRMNPKMQKRAMGLIPRLRTALLSGARSGKDARDAARWRTVEALAESRWDGTLGRPAMWWLRVSGVSGHSFGEVIDKVQIDAAMGDNDAN